MFRSSTVLLLLPLFLMSYMVPISGFNDNHLLVFRVIYNFEVELRGFGPRLRLIYGGSGGYDSRTVVSVSVSYVYTMEVLLSTSGVIRYKYVLTGFSIDSNGINRSLYDHINTTLGRKLNVIEEGENAPIDPKFILWVDYLNASVAFIEFSRFRGTPRFILIDREVPAYYRVDVFEVRNYTHTYVEYIAASYDAVFLTPLYLYYYSQIGSNDASEQVSLKIAMRSSVELDESLAKYTVRSARAVFTNGATVSILALMVGGEPALRVERDLNELSVAIDVLNASSTHLYRLVLVISNPSSTRLIGVNASLNMVSNTTVTIYSTGLIKGSYALRLVFNQNLSRVELPQNDNIIHLIDNRPSNLSPQAIVFTILFNAVAIQLCFLLGKKLSKWLID